MSCPLKNLKLEINMIFFKKNINKNLILIILLILSSSINGQEKKIRLSFEEIDFSIGREYPDKLIETYKEALKIGLCKESDTENKFYSNNAVYLFQVGGGCFGASPSEISIELENNLVNINWSEPKEICPDVGEAMAFYGKIIIPKRENLNYKEFKFKYYWE